MLNPGLAEAVVAASTRPHSYHHGERHWKAVAWAGLQLVPRVPTCDSELVLLFALFHDSQRLNEFDDPEHGARGGKLARAMCGSAFQLEPPRLDLLIDACTSHDKGTISNDPTVGACWDADRLNLWRVGKEPAVHLLSTEPARDAALVAEAASYHGLDLSWPDLFARYSLLMER